jgi:hypothetical protein
MIPSLKSAQGRLSRRQPASQAYDNVPTLGTVRYGSPFAEMQARMGSIGGLSYKFVLAHGFTTALRVADQVIPLAPTEIWLYGNRAHALMFLDRVDEARAIYLQFRGEKNVVGDKAWKAVVLEDFAELRKAGLMHPLMDEIEKRFAAGG